MYDYDTLKLHRINSFEDTAVLVQIIDVGLTVISHRTTFYKLVKCSIAC